MYWFSIRQLSGKWQHKPTRLRYLRFLATRRVPQEPDDRNRARAVAPNDSSGSGAICESIRKKDYMVANDNGAYNSEEQSSLSKRLEEYTEEALSENPRFMKAAVASGEFDFNKELKQKLLERIASADFNSENAQALATASIPVRICYPSHEAVWQLTR